MENEENVDVENEEVEETKNTDTKAYTQDEVLALVQSEADKRVSQALATQEKKYLKDLQKQKSLSNLDADERAQAESDMRIQELEEQLLQYSLTNEKAEISKVLANRGLDVNLVDFVVVSDDNNENIERINTLDKIFKTMVKQEVESRIGSSTPKTSTVGLDGATTKEQFMKMSIVEQTDLYNNNKELYMQLSK